MSGPTLAENIQIFDKQANAKFMQKFALKTQKITAKFAGMVETVDSNGPIERFPMLGATPQLQEYASGDVPIGDLPSWEVTLANKKWGMAIPVDVDYFDDIDRMPGAKSALLKQVADGLAVRAANYPNKLYADLLLQNGEYSSMTTYDGKAMFANDHDGGDNIVAGTASAYDVDTLRTEHNTMLSLFSAHKDPKDHDYIREEAPNQLLYLVDPLYLADYATLLRSMSVPGRVHSDGTAGSAGYAESQAAQGNVLAGRNMAAGVDGLGNEVTLVGWSRLAGKTKTFVVDLTDDVPGTRAIIHQVRLAPQLMMLGASENNPNYVMGERLIWKVRMRGQVGIGDWQKIILITKS